MKHHEEAARIIEGRTVAPTDAEIEAHDRAKGVWIYTLRRGVPQVVWGDRAEMMARLDDTRWWPLDRDGRPCEWPKP